MSEVIDEDVMLLSCQTIGGSKGYSDVETIIERVGGEQNKIVSHFTGPKHADLAYAFAVQVGQNVGQPVSLRQINHPAPRRPAPEHSFADRLDFSGLQTEERRFASWDEAIDHGLEQARLAEQRELEGLTVGELVAQLQALPQDAPVLGVAEARVHRITDCADADNRDADTVTVIMVPTT